MKRLTALLTLGRLPKALDIAQSLNLAGWRVIIAEPFSRHLAGSSRHVEKQFTVTAPNTDQEKYLDELLAIIRQEEVSLIVPVSEEALHVSFIASRIPENVRLYSPDHETLLKMHNKWEFFKIARQNGLAVPETELLGTDKATQLAKSVDYVIKPTSTCSGQGLQLCNQGDLLPDIRELPQTIVQQKMPGALKSTLSIAHQGRVIGTVVYRAAILSGTVAVAFEKLDNEIRITQWINCFVEAQDYSGFIAFDFMEDETGNPHAIECNPRATSGIHFINRQDIAGAIIAPENHFQLGLRPHPFMQQFWPCLTETQVAFFKRDQFLQKLKIMFKAKEVNFAWNDPLPVWLMPYTSWEIMKRSFFKGESFGEASTFDVGWYHDASETV
ncbi:MAG: ATP-grasp domain-containing protein [Pseudomonadota bacterium]